MIDLRDVLHDLSFQHGLDDGEQAISAIVIIKFLDVDCTPQLAFRSTNDLCIWDAIGMLRFMLVDAERQAASYMTDVGDDPED